MSSSTDASSSQARGHPPFALGRPGSSSFMENSNKIGGSGCPPNIPLPLTLKTGPPSLTSHNFRPPLTSTQQPVDFRRGETPGAHSDDPAVAGFFRSRFGQSPNDSTQHPSNSFELSRSGTGTSQYQTSQQQRDELNSGLPPREDPNKTYDFPIDPNVKRISPQFLVQCYHDFKAKGRIGPHVSSPILSLASVPPDERRQQLAMESQPGGDVSTKPFGVTGGLSRSGTFPSKPWESSALTEDGGGPSLRSTESAGRGRGRGTHHPVSNIDHPPALGGRGGLSGTGGRGRGRSPGIPYTIPGHDSTTEHPTSDVHRDAYYDPHHERQQHPTATKPPRSTGPQESVPLWRRKDRSGSETIDTTQLQQPPPSTTPTTTTTQPSSSNFVSTTSPTQPSKTEPGQAGFLIGRSDSARIAASGLPPLTSSTSGICTPPASQSLTKLGSTSGTLADRLRNNDTTTTTKHPPFKASTSTEVPPHPNASFYHQTPQPGKFGVRDPTWVEDDWGSVRKQVAPIGPITSMTSPQHPSSSSSRASEDQQTARSRGASPHRSHEEWDQPEPIDSLNQSREDLLSSSSSSSKPTVSSKQHAWAPPPSRGDLMPNKGFIESERHWDSRHEPTQSQQDFHEPSSTTQQPASFWEASPIVHKERGTTAANEAPKPGVPPSTKESSIEQRMHSDHRAAASSSLPSSAMPPNFPLPGFDLPSMKEATRNVLRPSDDLQRDLYAALLQQQRLHPNDPQFTASQLLAQLRQQQRPSQEPSPLNQSGVSASIIDPLIESVMGGRPPQHQSGWPSNDARQNQQVDADRVLLEQLIGRVVGRQPPASHQPPSYDHHLPSRSSYPQHLENQPDVGPLLQSKLDAAIQSALSNRGAPSSLAGQTPGTAAALLQQLARERLARYGAGGDLSYRSNTSGHQPPLIPSSTFLRDDQRFPQHQLSIDELLHQQQSHQTSSLLDRLPDVLSGRHQPELSPDLYTQQRLGGDGPSLLHDTLQSGLFGREAIIDPLLQSAHHPERLWQQPPQARDLTAYRDRPVQPHFPPVQQRRDDFTADLLDSKLIDQQRSTIAPPSESVKIPISLEDCVWEYRDPKGQVQGQFSSIQMKTWNDGNFFPGNLLMRYKPSHPWVKFRALFPVQLNSVFPPFMGFPIVHPDGSVTHPINSSQQLSSPPELDHPVPQSKRQWDDDHQQVQPSSGQSISSGSVGASSPPLPSIEQLYQSSAPPSMAQHKPMQQNVAPTTQVIPPQQHLLNNESEPMQQQQPPAPRHHAELMTNNLKAMLGLPGSNASSRAESPETEVKIQAEQSQQQSMKSPVVISSQPGSDQSIVDASSTKTASQSPQQKRQSINEPQSRTTTGPTIASPVIPNPMAGVAIPPTRKPKPANHIEQQQQQIIEKRPLLPLQPREPVQDLLEVMQEEEIKAKQERLIQQQIELQRNQDGHDDDSSRSKGGAAWKVPTTHKAAVPPAVFDESDFPDPSAALFQSKGSSGRSKQKGEPVPVKGSKKTPLSEFFKTDTKSQPIKTVWGRTPKTTTSPINDSTPSDFKLHDEQNMSIESIETHPIEKPTTTTQKKTFVEPVKSMHTVTASIVDEPFATPQQVSDWTTVSKKKEQPTSTTQHSTIPLTKKQQTVPTPVSTRSTTQPLPSSATAKPEPALPTLNEEELTEIHKLLKTCKINLDDEMIEFLKGCKSSDDIIDILQDSLEDRTHLSFFATEFVGICQNPFRTVTYSKGGTGAISTSSAGWKQSGGPSASKQSTSRSTTTPLTSNAAAVRYVPVARETATTTTASRSSTSATAKQSNPQDKSHNTSSSSSSTYYRAVAKTSPPSISGSSSLTDDLPISEAVSSEQQKSSNQSQAKSKAASVGKRSKKGGKGKAVDPSLLGFSVKSNRIMQGAIDYGE